MMNKRFFITAVLMLLCTGAAVLLQGGLTPGNPAWNPLLQERLPRLLILWMNGASLAVAGALVQGFFANPLAAPTVLGITAGGHLAVILGIWAGVQLLFPAALAFTAIVGCLTALILVYAIAKQIGLSNYMLLLTGIACTALLSAMQGALLYALRHNWELMQGIAELQAGSTLFLTWQDFHLQFPLVAAGLFAAYKYAAPLNLLSLGLDEALHLGVDVAKARRDLFLIIAVLTAAPLAVIGDIPFLGLIIPHACRWIVPANHEKLLPACALAGAAALALLDLCIRVLPWQVSISHLSGVMGGLFFFILLVRSAKRQHAVC